MKWFKNLSDLMQMRVVFFGLLLLVGACVVPLTYYIAGGPHEAKNYYAPVFENPWTWCALVWVGAVVVGYIAWARSGHTQQRKWKKERIQLQAQLDKLDKHADPQMVHDMGTRIITLDELLGVAMSELIALRKKLRSMTTEEQQGAAGRVLIERIQRIEDNLAE